VKRVTRRRPVIDKSVGLCLLEVAVKPAPFVYHRPASLPDALALLERYGAEGRVLAGGQSLVPALNMRLATPGALIDINRIPGLDEIRLGAEGLRRAATARTRAIIVNHPVNPTGHVLDDGEMDAVAGLAAERDLLVISDEIYERIAYPGTTHRSLAARPDLAGRTLTVNGFSKAYAMTGWRLGYVAGPANLMHPLRKVQDHSIYCVAPFIQEAGVAALTGPQDCVKAMCAEYLRRREAFLRAVGDVPGVQVSAPQGAFYTFPRFDVPGVPARRLAEVLLEVGGVAATAGTAFGACGEEHLRFTLRVPPETMPAVAAGVAKALAAARAREA